VTLCIGVGWFLDEGVVPFVLFYNVAFGAGGRAPNSFIDKGLGEFIFGR